MSDENDDNASDPWAINPFAMYLGKIDKQRKLEQTESAKTAARAGRLFQRTGTLIAAGNEHPAIKAAMFRECAKTAIACAAMFEEAARRAEEELARDVDTAVRAAGR